MAYVILTDFGIKYKKDLGGEVMDYKELGKRIKAARLSAGLTQEQLAELVNLSSGHCAHVEHGTTKVSLSALVKIANALNTTPDSLLLDSNHQATSLLLGEAQDLFDDCDPDEIYVILQAAAAIKKSIRIRKLKRADLD
jgi:transcriptional regulator with XRE-family HTH domain